jgi:hypothetical protein
VAGARPTGRPTCSRRPEGPTPRERQRTHSRGPRRLVAPARVDQRRSAERLRTPGAGHSGSTGRSGRCSRPDRPCRPAPDPHRRERVRPAGWWRKASRAIVCDNRTRRFTDRHLSRCSAANRRT